MEIAEQFVALGVTRGEQRLMVLVPSRSRSTARCVKLQNRQCDQTGRCLTGKEEEECDRSGSADDYANYPDAATHIRRLRLIQA